MLFKNEKIKTLFNSAEFLYKQPITVSNLEFHKKELIIDDVFFVGDAAGLITPLSGNGMSMALHASYILGRLLIEYLAGAINKDQLYSGYEAEWNKAFKLRMAVGRIIQKNLRKEKNADRIIKALKIFPFFNQSIIRLTHGAPFLT